ncbi:MAG: hypothetical protein JXR62_05085, partial [Bacilli bacterium]|nr:hypothetical protein [Bacilli bacterium]
MELLERYLNQVEHYLFKKDRKDTVQELKSLILEELDARLEQGENQEEALKEILKGFGDPKTVALRYRNEQPLIPRHMEPLMYLIIKILSITIPLSLLLANTIEFFNRPEPYDFMDIILNMVYTIPSIINALVAAIGFVFIGSFLVARYINPKIQENTYVFDPTKLPAVPKNVYKVSLFESLFLIFGSIIFLYLINLQPGLIAIYFDGESIPLLNENFEKILPYFNFTAIFQLGISIAHVYLRRKTFFTTTLEFFHAMISGVVLIFLASSDVFNLVVIENYNLTIIPTMFTIGMYIGAIGSFIGGITNYVKVFFAKS